MDQSEKVKKFKNWCCEHNIDEINYNQIMYNNINNNDNENNENNIININIKEFESPKYLIDFI